MCGITGWLSKKRIDKNILLQMTRVLKHRGPDGEGFLFKEYPSLSVGLGHRRLRIIDLVTGDQPMSNERGDIWIVFNGEIYNFPQLRETLLAKGHRFSTRSDTEVIIHLYEEKGIDCLQELNGMFAFAIWDEKKRRLFLARDRLGIKPLYYLERGGDFAFSSELKSFLFLPFFERKIDPLSLHNYLALQYIPSPLTIYQEVKKLPPAHFLVWEDGNLEVQRFWELRYSPSPDRGEKYYRKTLRELVEDSVRLRLISDVPFGAFLSGGIDSSIVVGIMAEFLEQKVKTFSMGFDVASFNELPYARLVAKKFLTQHYEFRVKPPNVLELLPLLIWFYDEPFADSSAIPTYMVSRLARRYVTMVLSGDGGDEVFGGYHRYLAETILTLFHPFFRMLNHPFLLHLINQLPESTRINDLSRRLKKLLARREDTPAGRYASWLLVFDQERRNALYTPEFQKEVKENMPEDYLINLFETASVPFLLGKSQFTDINSYLPEDILTKVDRASMANSLECRVPFLDHRIVEFMFQVPSHYKLRGFLLKYLLKKTFRDILPARIYYRGKHGFGVPMGRWFRRELADFTSRILLERRTLSRGYFNPQGIKNLLEEHRRGQFDHSHRLWALLLLELWHRFYIDNRSLTFPEKVSLNDL